MLDALVREGHGFAGPLKCDGIEHGKVVIFRWHGKGRIRQTPVVGGQTVMVTTEQRGQHCFIEPNRPRVGTRVHVGSHPAEVVHDVPAADHQHARITKRRKVPGEEVVVPLGTR